MAVIDFKRRASTIKLRIGMQGYSSLFERAATGIRGARKAGLDRADGAQCEDNGLCGSSQDHALPRGAAHAEANLMSKTVGDQRISQLLNGCRIPRKQHLIVEPTQKKERAI